MSLTTQQKFERAMQQAADARDMDLVINRQNPNIGTCMFQPQDRFRSVLSFPFEFQSDHARFAVAHNEPGELGPLNETAPRTGFWRVEGEGMDAVVVRVGEVLDGSGWLPNRRPDLDVREEALTQVQHLAYETIRTVDQPYEDEDEQRKRFDLAVERLSRINVIAEGMAPDEQWEPIQENGDGDVIAGGDRELALFAEKEKGGSA